MISRQDILERAAEWGLRPDVVEKDYVLGWVLAALATHDETSSMWVFKGGTCLKKCYYETYRFSEDLDFSLKEEAVYERGALEAVLREVADICGDASGIRFSEEHISVRERKDAAGRVTFEGKIGYQGPLAIPTWPRVKFDLTQHELIVCELVRREIIHPYPDDLPSPALIQTYSFDELLAEKTRALVERVRPRDLYDVVFLLSNLSELPDHTALLSVFREKCKWKELDVPTSSEVVQLVLTSSELHADWDAMLAHQLPELPPLEDTARRLGDVLIWLDGRAVRPRGGLSPAPVGTGALVTTHGIEFSGTGSGIQVLRFAGANRLLVEFLYHGKNRVVEPYSLRRPSTGNLLFYGWELASGQIKAFKMNEIQRLRSTRSHFTPRFAVELSASGPLSVPASVRIHRTPTGRRSRSIQKKRPYVVECTSCGKRFYRSKHDTSMRKHKTKDGWDCPGRHGFLVDVPY